jgi:3-mercaptopyruvate sulfurtransferase SseA
MINRLSQKEVAFMNVRRTNWLSVFTLLVAAFVLGCTATQETGQSTADWQFDDIAELPLVQQYAKVPQPEGAMIIDSRPCKPKFVQGHIPTAVNIPDSQFAEMTDKLPQDKNTLLIFYCGGPT